MPKVSVILPAYNGERFIAAAVESVLSQDYKDYEIIVVNDGSTDSTAEVLIRFKEKIKYIFQANGGPAAARNTGILNAQGEYIAFLDADDAWLPDKLKMQIPVLDKNNDVGLVYTDTYILSNEKFDKNEPGRIRSFQLRPPHRGKVFEKLFLENFISTSSVVVRKECFNKIGFFNPLLSPIEDFDRWLRLAILYEIDYINAPLVKYRDHMATFRKDEILTLTNIINTFNGIIAEYPVIKETLRKRAGMRVSQFSAALGKLYFCKGDFRRAFQSFSLAMKLARHGHGR